MGLLQLSCDASQAEPSRALGLIPTNLIDLTVERTEPTQLRRCAYGAHLTLNLDSHVSYVYAIVFTFPISDILTFILVFLPLLCT
jgi:hypothetical protein